MREYHDVKIIGIDNGCGNIRTANCCFPAGLTAHGAEPAFKDDLLACCDAASKKGRALTYE